MTAMTAKQFISSLRGELRLDEPMHRHTTWRVGGTADRFYLPADREDLQIFLQSLPADEPLAWVGLGSNLLVRDAGFRGTLIAPQQGLVAHERLDGDRVRLEAGLTCAKAARFCSRHGLCGLEFFAGIPGTVGGALFMNAGAFGGETWSQLIEVETMDRHGSVHRRRAEEFNVAYRNVQMPVQEEWFVSAIFQLQPGDAEQSTLRIKALLEERNRRQPIGAASCGSVFRNPPGDFAARLIEASGLKGVCVNGATVSEKHANFILNSANATAADIEALVKLVQERVQQQHGLLLQPEFQILGEPRRFDEEQGS